MANNPIMNAKKAGETGYESLRATEGSMHSFASAQTFGPAIPDDVAMLNFNALYIGIGGDVAIEPVGGGTPVVFTNVPNGTVLPVRGQRVRATGTTVSDVVWLKW